MHTTPAATSGHWGSRRSSWRKANRLSLTCTPCAHSSTSPGASLVLHACTHLDSHASATGIRRRSSRSRSTGLLNSTTLWQSECSVDRVKRCSEWGTSNRRRCILRLSNQADRLCLSCVPLHPRDALTSLSLPLMHISPDVFSICIPTVQMLDQRLRTKAAGV